MMKLIFLFMSLSIVAAAMAQKEIPLYKNKIPNAKQVSNQEKSEINNDGILIISKITQPTISVFLPAAEKRNGTAVIIFPGGGYQIVAAGHEGYDVAKQFNEMGVTAFVVKYRIPDDATMVNKEIGPLQDAQRAIQYVREHAAKYKINTRRIGIMGFSAGGHLASTAGTHFKKSYIVNKKNTNLRPDFIILAYPVISFTDSIGHRGSRDHLLGEKPTIEKIKEYSNELQVTGETPPTFLMHAKDDDAVPVQNSILFYDALKKSNVPAEIFLYEKGGHGFGMNNKTSEIKWMDKVEEWMKKQGWLEKLKPSEKL
jgi:acetyl esterase/lipase